MSRISETFARLAKDNKKALVPFVTCGDPRPETTLHILHELVAQGADIIELGVPFSDPMADGPAIQLANERALAHETGLPEVFEIVRQFRQQNTDTPIVLMGYMNPIEYMGYGAFAEKAKAVGVDGLITVDLPPEECDEFIPVLKANSIDPIFLLTPTTSDDRAKRILSHCSGYVYYVSLKGVTGSNQLNVDDVASQVQRLKAYTDLPITVGFGIKNAETATAVSKVAEGVVVGSALVNQVAALADETDEVIAKEVAAIISTMRQAMDA